jgi:predicted TIM-barrel fold metal-dependent hydrolase
MQIIDIHTHVYPRKVATAAVESIKEFYRLEGTDMDGTAPSLIQRGREAGVSRFVLLPVANRAGQVSTINNFIAGQVQENDCFIGLGAVHAEMEDMASEVDRIAELGLRGIKIHPDFQKFPIDDPRLFPVYETVRGKMPVLFHMGDPRYDYSHPARLRRVLELFPGLEVIAAHLGGYSMYETARELLQDTDCVMDISSSVVFLDPGMPEKYINHYGAERIAFGSDYPMFDPFREVNNFLQFRLTDAQKEQIAYKTAERILKL